MADRVQTEAQQWLGEITQPFGVHGETGVDIGLPYHTPVYALTSGPVLGSGYYGGGGVVSQKSPLNLLNLITGQESVYYQHLDENAVSAGQYVPRGGLIGYSGGQIGYGHHPSDPKFSSGPHIEVGINAPYGGMWDPLGKNVNPKPLLQEIAQGGTGSGPPCDWVGFSLCNAKCFGDPNCIQACIQQFPSCGQDVNNAASAASNLDPLNAIGNAISQLGTDVQAAQAATADAMKRIGVFFLAVMGIAVGVYILLHERNMGADITTKISGSIGPYPVRAQADTLDLRRQSATSGANVLGLPASQAPAASGSNAGMRPAPILPFARPAKGKQGPAVLRPAARKPNYGKAQGLGPQGRNAINQAVFQRAAINRQGRQGKQAGGGNTRRAAP